jgi:hypothetical protein
VRRIAHLEIALAERGKSGESLATVVGEERKAAAPAKMSAKPKAKAVSKAKAKKPAKKKVAAKK